MTKVEETTVAAEDLLWALWRDVVSEFGLRRMMWSLIRSKTGWGFYGMDMASTLRATPMARGAIARLSGVSPRELERLAALAGVNGRRGEAMWRMAVMFYVTVPVGIFLAGLEGAPDFIKSFGERQGFLVVPFVLLLTIWLAVYFANQWRAKQVEAVIDMARIERGLVGTDHVGSRA